MDSSIVAARYKQFKILYRYLQIKDIGRFLFKGKMTLEEAIAYYQAKPQYQKLVESVGQKQADYLTWWTAWIVHLYQKFGPGQVEAAWWYFLGFIKEREEGAV